MRKLVFSENGKNSDKFYSNIVTNITFSSYEKVLVLCEKSHSEFSSNLYVLRPREL